MDRSFFPLATMLLKFPNNACHSKGTQDEQTQYKEICFQPIRSFQPISTEHTNFMQL